MTISGPIGRLVDVNLHGLNGGEVRLLPGAWVRIQNVMWENVPIWKLPLKPTEALFGLFDIAAGGTCPILRPLPIGFNSQQSRKRKLDELGTECMPCFTAWQWPTSNRIELCHTTLPNFCS